MKVEDTNSPFRAALKYETFWEAYENQANDYDYDEQSIGAYISFMQDAWLKWPKMTEIAVICMVQGRVDKFEEAMRLLNGCTEEFNNV
jgi:hypothetical protein